MALVTAAACGPRSLPPSGDDAEREAEPVGAQTSAEPPGEGGAAPGDRPAQPSGEGPLMAAALVELMIDGPKVWLQITRETGASDVVDVGTFAGDCARATPAGDEPIVAQEAVFAVDCAGAPPARLRFVKRGNQLVLLEARGGELEPGQTFALPAGMRIEFGQPE